MAGTVRYHERTHSCTSIYLFSGMSDSEVSPEAELGKTSAMHPRVDCVEAEETLNEDVKEESVGGSRRDGEDEVMYDIDINSDDENTERRDRDVQRGGEVSRSGHEEACSETVTACMSGSVDDEELGIKQEAEAPEEGEESHTELKVMFALTWTVSLCSVSVCGCFGGGGLRSEMNIPFQHHLGKKINIILS